MSASSNDASEYLPTENDLDQLAEAIHLIAEQKDLSTTTVIRYKAWNFLFLSWCLKMPPFQVHQDRIDGFRTALLHRQVDRWKISEAMDALGVFFGVLEDTQTLSFSDHPPSMEMDALTEEAVVDMASALPDCPLPVGTDARAEVPTVAEQPDAAAPSPDAASPSEAASPSDSSESVSSAPPSEGPTFWNVFEKNAQKQVPDLNARVASRQKETMSIQIPQSLADRVHATADALGLSKRAFVVQALSSACKNADREPTPNSASGPLDHLKAYQEELDRV